MRALSSGVEQFPLLEHADDPWLAEVAGIWRTLALADAQWEVRRSADSARLWLLFRHREATLEEQGWKLHLAAQPACAGEVLRRVLPLLLRRRAVFKVVASLTALQALNQGQYGWSQMGKFLTIYPSDEEEAVLLAGLLDEQTRSLPALRIPSDRALRPGSLVHYRYGSLRGELLMQEADGLISPALRGPAGELLPEQRRPFYVAPAGRCDPFLRAGIARTAPEMPRLLDRRYLLASVLSRSPTHTLYLAGDLLAARSCVVKGPGLLWQPGTSEDSITRGLLHEASLLRALSDLAQVPDLYACLENEYGVFLVLQDIQGETLEALLARSRNQGPALEKRQIIAWGGQLAELLRQLHQRGLVYADLKPANVLYAQDGRLHLVDFELTDRQGSLGAGERGTRGYSSPRRQRGLPLACADDIYSFGALLYALVTGAEPAEAPDPAHLLTRPPAWFSSTGAQLQDIISRCLSAGGARYASMQEIQADLEYVSDHDRAIVVSSSAASAEAEPSWEQLAQELLRTLGSLAQREPGQPGVFWRSAHPLTYGLAARDLNAGNAGTLLAFAELVDQYPQAGWQTCLGEAARWLQDAPLIAGQPLPGLYIGEAGVGAALLRAGQVLRDHTLIAAACARGRLVAGLPFTSPDLFHGTAGRLRFHLWLWDETDQREHLEHALVCGEHLLAVATTNQQREVCWTLPQGYRQLSGQSYTGYAHGAAGIADALLDLYEVSEDTR
ncbi:MAG TPA: lanthionine synthetase LanC family protein, partial [Ktedonobacteraceae bacterium]|nr:lanthionine synthetase LanC family protein [Ktedonobacteraceae bacterium]